MRNTFYFMWKALYVLEIFTLLSQRFGYVENQFDKTVTVNFEIYDVTDWETENYNTYIVKYLKK